MHNKIDYIFSINTGRSGSDYLSHVFKNVSGCRSLHEPDPKGNGKAMRRYSKGDSLPTKAITEEKVQRISAEKGNYNLYFESNHCFIKGFGWFIPNYLPEENIGIIILKRDKAKIAKSLLRIGCSPLDARGRDWVSTPDMKNPLVKPPTTTTTYHCARLTKSALRVYRFLARKIFKKEVPFPKRLIDYELKCLQWYVDETNAKAEAYKKRFPKIKYYETNIEDLNSPDSVESMLAYFGHQGNDILASVVGKPTNLKRKTNTP